ncbi:MAG TPA: hypothetical protein VGS00_07400, partial [Thermoanaerobaculia bacterium]|nr:hypothetical protein [Thermoanaerobaculia bacterium]
KLEKDIPEGPLGRISLAIAPSNGNHVYAMIDSKKGILFESKDLGEHWEKLTDNRTINVRPWYFSVIAVSPADENKIYFGSYQLVTSIDGGKTFQTNNRRIHPDYHALWIDPRDPERIIQGNDGGALVSSDGGKSWRAFENLPLGQFYQVAVDSNVPYMVCGGLQDNNGWCGASNSLARGGIGGADWFVVAGGDGEYAVPAPSDPNVIYADSQNGNISRFDRKTKISRNIRPYLRGASDTSPADLKYRFNWTTPIAVSATDVNEVYVGGNVVFKSSDGGLNWTEISQDLSRNDKSKQVVSGGPTRYDLSGAETYGTLLSLVISPVDAKVLWAGSDDGLVHVTKNGGKTWANVTPKGAPEWTRVYQIDASPFDAGTAHVVFDGHKLGNRKAYAYRTADSGATWTPIMKGLPEDPVYVVRENPNKKGFLVAGTDMGLQYSADAGATWKKLSGDFPTVPVWDLKFVKSTHDLVIGTHGRGMYVLDNITALEDLDAAIEGKALHVFTPLPAAQWQIWNRGGFAIGEWTAPNPPNGVVIDYYLKSEIKQTEEQKKQRREPVKITVTDAKGNPVTTEYGQAKEGINRHVWQMRYEGAKKLTFGGEAPPPNEFFDANRGPDVVPGAYKVTVSAAGETLAREVSVSPDPRFSVDAEALRLRTKTALEIRNQVSGVNEALNRLDGWETQLTALPKLVRGGDEGESGPGPAAGASKKYEASLKASRDMSTKVKDLKDKVYNREIQRSTPSDTLHFHSDFQGKLSRLGFGALGAYGEAPREVVKEEIAAARKEVDAFLAQFNALLASDVPAFNKTAAEQGVPTLFVGEAISVQPPAGF